ncbi:MAG: hypothetical protein WCA10_06385 [Terracidiphilus sp.]
MRRELAKWAQQAHDLSQRYAAGLIPASRASLRYEHHRDPPGRLACAAAGTGRQPGAVWISKAD